MYFGRLEDLRIDADLTQQQVADILNCKREVYRRYEKGIRELPLSYAIILAEYYSVTIDYIVGLSDKKSCKYHIQNPIQFMLSIIIIQYYFFIFLKKNKFSFINCDNSFAILASNLNLFSYSHLWKTKDLYLILQFKVK